MYTVITKQCACGRPVSAGRTNKRKSDSQCMLCAVGRSLARWHFKSAWVRYRQRKGGTHGHQPRNNRS